MKEVAPGIYRQMRSPSNFTKLSNIVTQKMAIMLIVVRPQLLPRGNCDDERTKSRQRLDHRPQKVCRLLDVLYHIEQENSGYAFPQTDVEIRKVRLRKNKALDIFGKPCRTWNSRATVPLPPCQAFWLAIPKTASVSD